MPQIKPVMATYNPIALLDLNHTYINHTTRVKGLNMELGERISIADPYLGLLSHRNRGAAWGMLEGQMWLFYIVTVIVVAGIIYFFHKEAKGSVLF